MGLKMHDRAHNASFSAKLKEEFFGFFSKKKSKNTLFRHFGEFFLKENCRIFFKKFWHPHLAIGDADTQCVAHQIHRANCAAYPLHTLHAVRFSMNINLTNRFSGSFLCHMIVGLDLAGRGAVNLWCQGNIFPTKHGYPKPSQKLPIFLAIFRTFWPFPSWHAESEGFFFTQRVCIVAFSSKRLTDGPLGPSCLEVGN